MIKKEHVFVKPRNEVSHPANHVLLFKSYFLLSFRTSDNEILNLMFWKSGTFCLLESLKILRILVKSVWRLLILFQVRALRPGSG